MNLLRMLWRVGIGGRTMMFNFAFACFGLAVALGACGFVTASAMACMEKYKTAVIASAIMVVSVAMAFGFGGAIWG
jgi:hypothetical protein